MGLWRVMRPKRINYGESVRPRVRWVSELLGLWGALVFICSLGTYYSDAELWYLFDALDED